MGLAVVKPAALARMIVDITVPEQVVAHPTGRRLLASPARERLTLRTRVRQ